VGIYAGPNFVVGEGFPYSSLFDAMGAQVNPVIGYQFSPVISLRAGLDIAQFNWPKIPGNTILSAGSQSIYLDAVLNLSNAFATYDLYRVLDISIFGGAGLLFRSKGDYVAPFNAFFGRVGGQFDVHLTQFVDLNLRADLNITSDIYNEVIGGAPVEILPAAMVGITYHFRTNKPFKKGCCN
jgi:hypothetical protein